MARAHPAYPFSRRVDAAALFIDALRIADPRHARQDVCRGFGIRQGLPHAFLDDAFVNAELAGRVRAQPMTPMEDLHAFGRQRERLAAFPEIIELAIAQIEHP
ncbi:hypothetical protein G6F65_012856 [Rhizopus arrhizus]|nr:hypothetical protein G6F65_012856 [Rhizopus arrhizus]